MKFRLLSDIHFEYHSQNYIKLLPPLPDESDTIVLLAGDIFCSSLKGKCKDQYQEFLNWLENCCNRHHHVVYILGNHEYWYGDISYAVDEIKKDLLPRFKNLTILQDEYVEFNNVVVIGSTLWTDFYNKDPIIMWTCGNKIYDFRHISNIEGPQNPYTDRISKLIPEDLLPIHYKSKQFIFDSIQQFKREGKKTIVMTHHAPSALSISSQYSNHPTNGGYISDFSEELLDRKGPEVWCHGHVHSSNDYTLGGTRVLTNPHGISNENSQANVEEDALYFRYDFNFEV